VAFPAGTVVTMKPSAQLLALAITAGIVPPVPFEKST